MATIVPIAGPAPISASVSHALCLSQCKRPFALYRFANAYAISSPKGEFECVSSLFNIFRLRQFCSPLFGFFWLAPVFVEFDRVVKLLLGVRIVLVRLHLEAYYIIRVWPICVPIRGYFAYRLPCYSNSRRVQCPHMAAITSK